MTTLETTQTEPDTIHGLKWCQNPIGRCWVPVWGFEVRPKECFIMGRGRSEAEALEMADRHLQQLIQRANVASYDDALLVTRNPPSRLFRVNTLHDRTFMASVLMSLLAIRGGVVYQGWDTPPRPLTHHQVRIPGTGR
jgi:hypothetical protein